MKFFKRKNLIIKAYDIKSVDGTEVWVVSWNARLGDFSYDKKRVAKSFLSHEDAMIFINSLKEAKTLLQDKDNINIQIEKQI